MLPSPNDLAYFIEVAETQNISRASERLGISQPSVSLAIRRLEDELGVPILYRSKKGVQLTSAGKRLLLQARRLREEWKRVRTGAVNSFTQVEGYYRIGCHTSVALYSLDRFLPTTLCDFPNLEVELVHDLSRKVVESVVSMKVDLGIVVNPIGHPDLVVKKLCSDIVTLWTGAKKSKVNDPRSGEAVLICDPALVQSQDILSQFKRKGLSYKRLLTSSSLEVIRALVASNGGIGILPTRVAIKMSNRVKKVHSAPTFEDEVCLVYRVENRSNRAIQELGDQIKRSLMVQ